MPNPLAQALGSEGSSSNNGLALNLALDCESDLQDIFRGAHHFTQKDCSDAVDERQKNEDISVEDLRAAGPICTWWNSQDANPI